RSEAPSGSRSTRASRNSPSTWPRSANVRSNPAAKATLVTRLPTQYADEVMRENPDGFPSSRVRLRRRRCSHSGIGFGPFEKPLDAPLGRRDGIVAAGLNPAAKATLVTRLPTRYADAIQSTSGTGG